MKKYLIILSVIIMLTMSGCMQMFGNTQRNPIWEYDFSEMRLIQLEPPVYGQPLVHIYTTHGVLTAMLFPDEAPEIIENFIDRIKEGFYNNRPFFYLAEELFLITGAYDENGHQGVTADGNLIPNVHSPNLWPFKGSLMAFSTRQGFGDSRFLICGSEPISDEDAEQIRGILRQNGEPLIPEEVLSALLENESMAGFLGWYTIFGQVIDGMEVLDKLLSLESDENNRPLENIFIEKIELSEYQ
jgi:peptidyl-prolyl cis-trans isomerase B (cyclophilin B)